MSFYSLFLYAMVAFFFYQLGRFRTIKEYENHIRHLDNQITFWREIAEKRREKHRGYADPMPPIKNGAFI